MTGSLVLYLLLILILLLAHGFFVLLSAALIHAKPKKLEDEEFKVSFGRKKALQLLESAEQNSLSAQAGRLISLLLTVLLCVNLVGAQFFSRFYPPGGLLDILINFCFLFSVGIVALVFVQFAWAIAYAYPEKSLCYSSFLSRPLFILLAPLGFIANQISLFFNKKFSLTSPVESQQSLSVDEFVELVDYNEELDEEHDEMAMLRGVVDLSEQKVSEVMTPRQDVATLSSDSSMEEAVKEVRAAEFSRMLVIGDALDDVKGLLIARDLIKLISEDLDSHNLVDFVRPVISVSGDENLLKLLSIFRAEGAHFAVVMDEHGGVDGIITMEDVLEEIVGEIFDEFDNPAEDQDYKTTISGDLLIDGGALIDDLNQEYGLKLPEGEYDTIAGFVIDQIGKMPTVGEVVLYNGFRLIVEDFNDNRINQVRLVVQPQS